MRDQCASMYNRTKTFCFAAPTRTTLALNPECLLYRFQAIYEFVFFAPLGQASLKDGLEPSAELVQPSINNVTGVIMVEEPLVEAVSQVC